MADVQPQPTVLSCAPVLPAVADVFDGRAAGAGLAKEPLPTVARANPVPGHDNRNPLRKQALSWDNLRQRAYPRLDQEKLPDPVRDSGILADNTLWTFRYKESLCVHCFDNHDNRLRCNHGRGTGRAHGNFS